ncbi:hypothetical protein HNQ38_002613 [Desulfovibrio intestinalis]|uniref:Uncharacterized protein n=1 Tax=Desulfovibrio intestinalis TaxID=58621 RepID=A0A7W8FG02_9BACT|nr:hypothetical protein [Desulfovibrio intestinalis]
MFNHGPLLWLLPRERLCLVELHFPAHKPCPDFRQATLNFPGGPQDGVSLYCRLPPGCALSPGTGGAAGRGVSGLPSGNRGTGCSIRRLVPRFYVTIPNIFSLLLPVSALAEADLVLFPGLLHCYIEGFVRGMHCAPGLFRVHPRNLYANHSSTAGYEFCLLNQRPSVSEEGNCAVRRDSPNEGRGRPKQKPPTPQTSPMTATRAGCLRSGREILPTENSIPIYNCVFEMRQHTRVASMSDERRLLHRDVSVLKAKLP